jgi:hypothetical protein
MIADQRERDAELEQRTDLEPPWEAGPHGQQWHNKDSRDSDAGRRDAARCYVTWAALNERKVYQRARQ